MLKYKIKKLEKSDIKQVIDIWNYVVIDGVAFPQTELLNEDTGLEFALVVQGIIILNQLLMLLK